MEEIGEKIVIALISAIIALYLKYQYDNIKEEKELQCNIYSFNRMIMNVYYPRLKEMNGLYDKALSIIEKSESNELSMPYSYLKTPLIDLYDKQFFAKISKRNNIPYQCFFDLSVLLQDLKDENFITVIHDYHKMNNSIMTMSNEHFNDLQNKMDSDVVKGILTIREKNYEKNKTRSKMLLKRVKKRMVEIDEVIIEIITKLDE